MTAHNASTLPAGPSPAVAAALRERMTGMELEAFSAVFMLRQTAQLLANVISGWMADSVSSPARFQVLMHLWAAKGRGVPQKEIVAALHVTKPTVSGLIAGLERDGLVTSAAATRDRRNQLAQLTPHGLAVMEKALETIQSRLREAFSDFSDEDFATLTTLMQRVRAGFREELSEPDDSLT